MKFSVTFLGGVGEIGGNCYLYETENSAIIVDCGLKFFQSEFIGIDFTIPDFRYLERVREKLKGVVITHGHEDHIGALPYFLKFFPLPIYAGSYAIRLIKHKIAQSKYRPKSFNTVADGETIILGDFQINFLEVNHSIPNSFFLIMDVDSKKYIHCGDFRVEKNPLIGKPFPFERLEEYKGDVEALFIDCTNVFNTSTEEEESNLLEKFVDIFKNSKGRVFFTTFSTNISRIKLVLEACKITGRKLLVEGNAFSKNINISRELSYLQIPENLIIPIEKIDYYEPEQLCIIITGCQGEPNSSLFKVAMMERKKLKINPSDTFVFSSTTIPGNEKNINRVINEIYLHNGNVIRGMHISGHATQNHILNVIHTVSPKWTIPIHGEIAHQRLLEKIIYEKKLSNPIFVRNGDKITFSNDEYCISPTPTGTIYIDQRGGFEYDDELFKEKKHLSRDGMIIVFYNKNRVILETFGFRLTDELDIKIKRYINDSMEKLKDITDEDFDLKSTISSLVRRYFKKNFEKRPIVKTITLEDYDEFI
ncbi:MAG: ribonuclease J [Calditerrivibrio sp.]|uniref:ribonuclease J n=1 Tax=Calditerrivibrio sp. TaxID=2792612 RepID=UPI003D136901